MDRPSATAFLFVTVFVDMHGYGLVVPLLPFYAGGLASGALLVGTLGSLYAAMQYELDVPAPYFIGAAL